MLDFSKIAFTEERIPDSEQTKVRGTFILGESVLASDVTGYNTVAEAKRRIRHHMHMLAYGDLRVKVVLLEAHLLRIVPQEHVREVAAQMDEIRAMLEPSKGGRRP